MMFGVINRVKNITDVFFKYIGTAELKGELINPYGLFTNPKIGVKGLHIRDINVVLPISDTKMLNVTLDGGHVVVTDGTSTIHLTADGKMELIGDVVITGKLNVRGSELKHNGINISATHTHIQQGTAPYATALIPTTIAS